MKKKLLAVFLFSATTMLCAQTLQTSNKYFEVGNFKEVHNPAWGVTDDPWCINDHTFIYDKKKKKWHVIGITHARKMDYIKDPGLNLLHISADSLFQTPWEIHPHALTADFKKYKELSERLETIYGKSVEEVEAFVTDQRNQLLYAKAQDQELKKQYALIRNYMEKGSFKVNEDVLSFYQAVGHGEASRNAREYGIFASNVKYITAKNVDGIVVRVLTTPDLVNGKTTITTTVTVLDKNNKVLEEICSKDLDAKAFNKAIFEIAEEYKLKECKTQKKNLRRNL